MKKLKVVLTFAVTLFLGFSLNAQSCAASKKAGKTACCAKKESSSSAEVSSENGTAIAVLVSTDIELKTEEVKVYGNCGMCKRRIEGALVDVKGLESAEWDMGTKMLKVSFDEGVITLDDIEKQVAAVGHDTDKFRAEDKVYSKLHGCCKYDRPEN